MRPDVSARRLLRKVRTMTFDLTAIGRQGFIKKLGTEPTCRSGCAYCCYAKILTDAASGAIIYLYLRANRQWTEALREQLVAADAAMTAVTHAAHLATQRPCVFLRETGLGQGECTIYPVRPLGCALTFSPTKTPTDCIEVGGHAQHQVMLGRETVMPLLALYDSVLRAMNETDHEIMTVPGAVLHGHARIEGLPLPKVRRLAIKDTAQETFDQAFDRFATEDRP